jgi:hypothetical protein
LPVQNSKKGQAKLVLFWSKSKGNPRPDGFRLGAIRFEEKAWPDFKLKTNRHKAEGWSGEARRGKAAQK